MDSVSEALLNDLTQKGFPNLATLWQPFLEHGCTIYLLSEPGYGPRDGYALSWVSRYLPPGVRAEVIPVFGELEEVSTKNLIIFGRLQSYEDRELVSQTLEQVIHDYAHYRFIDDRRLLQIDTGQLWSREEAEGWVKDFGVIRLWQRQDAERTIMNLCGLGPIGTLGAAMAVTDSRLQAMTNVEARLPEVEHRQNRLIEILVRAEWRPRGDPFIVNPHDVIPTVEEVFDAAVQPRWPLIHFQRIGVGTDSRYEVWVIDTQAAREKLLSQKQTEFAVLAAIAKHTASEDSMFVGKGGYISYEQIAESPIVKEILNDPTGLTAPAVRTIVYNLRQMLRTREWSRLFPSLLLESKVYAEGSRREIVVLRLRAKFQFNW